MPVYIYKCKWCGGTKEVVHSITEIDNPSEETLEETTCPYDRECRTNIEQHLGMETPTASDLKLVRVPQAPQLMGFVNGSSLKGSERNEEIQKERKKRSTEHFKKEIYPTIPRQEQNWFNKKWEAKKK
jgi:hypothetical protein